MFNKTPEELGSIFPKSPTCLFTFENGIINDFY